jgi:hypothetical protein
MARSSSGKAPRSSRSGPAGATPTGSGRVTAPSPAAPARRTNWVLIVVVVLVLVGLVGGFFVALVAGGGTPATTTLPVTVPG